MNLNKCQIKVVQGKGNKDRIIITFPNDFREVLAAYIKTCRENKIHIYLSLIGKRDTLIVELEKYYYTIQSYQV